MDYYVKSEAFQVKEEPDFYVLTNCISGKCYKMNGYVLDLWNRCSSKRTLSYLTSILSKDNFSETQISNLMTFFLNNNLLLKKREQAICDTVKNTTTSFGVLSADLKELQRGSIALIGVPFGQGNDVDTGCKYFPKIFRDSTNSYLHLNDQPDKLRKDSIHSSFNISNFLKLITENRIADIGDIFYCTGTDLSLYYNNISHIIYKVCEKENIPFVLGGDHSITYPVVKSIARFQKEFVLLHFDAHADYKRSDIMKIYNRIGFQLLNHATVMNHCEQISNLSEIIQCGIREPFVVESLKIKNISLSDMRYNSDKFNYLKEKECNIYLSFDIDYFDPTIAPGTASTIINGGLYEETFNFLSDILKNKKIIGVDLVEVNPRLDVRSATMNLAMNLVLQILSLIKAEKK